MKIQNILLLLALTMVVSITSASAEEIDLCAKAVNISHSWGVCDPSNPINGTFTYNTGGISMNYTATASGLSSGNYSLIYYKDTDANHTLASTIAVTVLDNNTASPNGNVSFSGTWTDGNIPAVDDTNPKGKIWIVPTSEIIADGNLTWTGYGQGNIMAGYLFESDSLPELGNENLTVQERMGGINYNATTPDTTPPVITNFTAVPGTHISRSNPTIMSADVTDINLELIDFMVVDINNLVRGDQTMLFRYTDHSGISGKYRSLPWDGTVLDMVNRDGTGNRTYITSMYVDDSECSDCQGTVMSPVQFKKNGTAEPVNGWAWFNRSTGNLSSLNLPEGYAEIEDGISTISVIKLTFPNGIDHSPVDHISDKTYIIYYIAGERSNLNPVLVSEQVPAGDYKILVHAVDTADNHNGLDSDISVGEPLYGVSLTADSLSKTTLPGVPATYVLTVNNTGNTADTYAFNVSNPDNVSGYVDQNLSVSLAPGDNQSFLLNVGGNVGTYRVNVTATSNNDPSKNATVNTITKILMAGITDFNASNGSRAGAIIANITVKNLDVTGHWYAVVAGGTDPVKGYPLAGTGVVYLAAGQEMKVPVLVTVPPSTPAGTYPIYAALYPYDSQILDPVSLIGQITGPKTVVVR